jgi:hypothetical protein
MDVRKLNGQQGRDSSVRAAVELQAEPTGAEGANLEQAKPDETLRQKDPVPDQTLESSFRSGWTIPTV